MFSVGCSPHVKKILALHSEYFVADHQIFVSEYPLKKFFGSHPPKCMLMSESAPVMSSLFLLAGTQYGCLANLRLPLLMGIHPAIACEHHDLIAVSSLSLLVEAHYLSHPMGIIRAFFACEHHHLILQCHHYLSLLVLYLSLLEYRPNTSKYNNQVSVNVWCKLDCLYNVLC